MYQEQGTALVRSQNVYDLRFNPEGLAHISDDAAAALKGVTVSAGDVLINITGESVTRTCLVDVDVLPARVSQHVAIVRPRPNKLDSRYLLYSLINPQIKAILNTLSEAGATRRALTKGHLESLEILLPPLREQVRIADALSAFDELIETNRRLANDLENLARICASRPTRRVPLGDVAGVPHLRQRQPQGVVDHYSIPAYDSGILPNRESADLILSGKQVLETDSVLISRLNPTAARTWMVYPSKDVPSVCSPEFVVVRGTAGVPAEVLWALASRQDFWDQMQSSVGGTTNSRQRVDKAAIPSFLVPDPRELGARQAQAIGLTVQVASELRREAQKVALQRDELVPLLVSGNVRVLDSETVD